MGILENYFDYAATTPVHPDVLSQMTPYFSEFFGNPSGAYALGQASFRAIYSARETIHSVFNAPKNSAILFTGSSTEAANLVIWSAVMNHWQSSGTAGRVLLSATEHSAVRNTVYGLARLGFCEPVIIPVDCNALVRLDRLSDELKHGAVLVSILGANNELGTIQPVAEIARMCQLYGIPYHCDATQLTAHSLIDLTDCPLDYMTISGHKLYGPKGVGAVIVRDSDTLRPQVFGAGQEMKLRAGTENVPYIVGIAAAYRLLAETFEERSSVELSLRERLILRVLDEISDVRLTGARNKRLTNHASFAFKNIDGLMLQSALDQRGFAVSVGSACRSNEVRGQQQLLEIGLGPEWVNGGLRITNGLYSTESSVDALVDAMKETVALIRRMTV